jgi:hypothetical protein
MSDESVRRTEYLLQGKTKTATPYEDDGEEEEDGMHAERMRERERERGDIFIYFFGSFVFRDCLFV